MTRVFQTDNASEQLAANNVRDFTHAMDLVIEQCQRRIDELTRFLQAAQNAKHSYRYTHATSTVDEIVKAWRDCEAGDENMEMITDALDSGNYTKLSI